MRKENKTIVTVLLLVIAACLIAAGGFFIGKNTGEKPLLEAQKQKKYQGV